MTENPMFVVVTGNPLDGLTLVGPFASQEAAEAWADTNLEIEWWAVRLISLAEIRRIVHAAPERVQ